MTLNDWCKITKKWCKKIDEQKYFLWCKKITPLTTEVLNLPGLLGVHVIPSPLNPSEQVQMKLPGVFSQVADGSQGCRSHSLTSPDPSAPDSAGSNNLI